MESQESNMKKKLLYVDDEQINLVLFKMTLSKDFDVVTSESPRQALDLVASTDFDFIVSDMNMPDLNGMQFIREAYKISPETSYYILSGYQENDEISKGIEEGLVKRFFTKPFEKQLLMEEFT